MGRLNYSARKISGAKLAQVVSKDLKKRIPPGIGSKAATRDPTLEIEIAGKDLTDDDFSVFIDDLLDCIKYRDGEHAEGLAKVTELHLQKNHLTVLSLVKLGEVIALNAGDLRELDLSNNSIRVNTPNEKKIWSSFLDAFENCYLLKKVDLGSNPLGPGGMEVLARVYIMSELDFIEDDAEDVIGPDIDEDHGLEKRTSALKLTDDKENESLRASRPKKSPVKVKAVRQNGHSHAASAVRRHSQAELKHFACTRGLRSIPFFILSDTAMTNGSAIHLASMLSIQRTPEHLLSFLPSGKTVSLPETIHEQKSIIWEPNDDLMPHTKRLLEVAEILTDSKADSFSEDDEFESEFPVDNAGEADPVTQRKLRKKMDVEYTRLTKRARMEALKVEGVHSMDLWITALKMMTVSRALLLEDKDRAEDPPEDPPSEEESPKDSFELIEDRVEVRPHHAEGPVHYQVHLRHSDHNIPEIVIEEYPGPYEFTETPAAMPSHHSESDGIEDNFPALPPVADTMTEAKGIPSAVSEPSGKPSPTHKDSSRVAGKGTVRAALTASKSFRKMTWRFGLPLEIWRRIIADAVGADGILTPQQQMQIIRYAADWNSVSYEMTIVGAEDHQQIWKFLETVNCFTYSAL